MPLPAPPPTLLSVRSPAALAITSPEKQNVMRERTVRRLRPADPVPLSARSSPGVVGLLALPILTPFPHWLHQPFRRCSGTLFSKGRRTPVFRSIHPGVRWPVRDLQHDPGQPPQHTFPWKRRRVLVYQPAPWVPQHPRRAFVQRVRGGCGHPSNYLGGKGTGSPCQEVAGHRVEHYAATVGPGGTTTVLGNWLPTVTTPCTVASTHASGRKHRSWRERSGNGLPSPSSSPCFIPFRSVFRQSS
jgi:hypothetical protein